MGKVEYYAVCANSGKADAVEVVLDLGTGAGVAHSGLGSKMDRLFGIAKPRGPPERKPNSINSSQAEAQQRAASGAHGDGHRAQVDIGGQARSMLEPHPGMITTTGKSHKQLAKADYLASVEGRLSNRVDQLAGNAEEPVEETSIKVEIRESPFNSRDVETLAAMRAHTSDQIPGQGEHFKYSFFINYFKRI